MVMLVRLVLLPPAAVGVNVEVYLLLAAENHSIPEVNPTRGKHPSFVEPKRYTNCSPFMPPLHYHYH